MTRQFNHSRIKPINGNAIVGRTHTEEDSPEEIMAKGMIIAHATINRKEEQINLLKRKAEKWDCIQNSSFYDYMKETYQNLETALMDCSCLQQLVIEASEENEDGVENLPHIRYATQRLMDFMKNLYYLKQFSPDLFDE